MTAFDAGAGGAGPIPIPFPLLTLASAVLRGAGDACRSFVVSLSVTVAVDVGFSFRVLEEGEDWRGAGGVGDDDFRRVAGAGLGTPRPTEDDVGSGGGTRDLEDDASALIADGVSNSTGFTFGVAWILVISFALAQ